MYTLSSSASGSAKRGKMADVPKADDVCLRHSVQWHIYSASGFSSGVLKVTEPHWQLASMVYVYAVGAGDEYVSGILCPEVQLALSQLMKKAGEMSSSNRVVSMKSTMRCSSRGTNIKSTPEEESGKKTKRKRKANGFLRVEVFNFLTNNNLGRSNDDE